MSPKKRKIAVPTDAVQPEPKKRVTRSSSKPNVPGTAASRAVPSTPTTPVTSRSIPQKPKSSKFQDEPKRSESEKPKDAEAPASLAGSESIATEEDAARVTSLTIAHDSLKNPIPCQRWLPSESGDGSSMLIFTHGAGGTLGAPAVVNFCAGYSTSNPVLAFQGSMNLNARVKGFHACVSHIRDSKDIVRQNERLLLGGRSMGARAAVMASTEILASKAGTSDESVKSLSLILVSYPLKGPKDDIRDKILLDLPALVRVLFVIGERDSMCPLDMLNSVREKMKAQSQLVIVKSADHGMHIKPTSLEKEMGEESGRLAAAWARGDKLEAETHIG